MPLAGYLRVSHVGGRGGDSFHSPDDQIAEILAWAKAHGHRVEMLAPELDAKGSDASRPIFRQAVDGVKAGNYSGVVVAYLSRAGRDLRLMLDLWDEVEAAGGAVYSARENIDASTTSGRLHRNLLAAIAQHELEERRDGFDRARRGAVERGIWQARQTPRGYSRDSETRRLVVDERADGVRTGARDFLSGKSIVAIAKNLGMTPGGIRAMLRNRVYLGELKVGQHINPTAHEALIDVATFEAIQAKLDSRTRPAQKGRDIMLLAGLVRCSSCGHVMTRGSSKGGLTYSCVRLHSGTRCPAPAGMSCLRLDHYIEEIALQELARLQVVASASDRAGGMQMAVEGAERELAAYLEAVDVAGVGAADAAEGMRRRRAEVDEARRKLRIELARTPAIPKIEGGVEAWRSLNAHDRNQLLRGLLAAVVVRPVGRGQLVDVSERVRVLRYGAEIRLATRNSNEAAGIIPIWPDADAVDVLRISTGEDALEGASGAG